MLGQLLQEQVFFYQFQIGDASVPVIVTNKHVIKDAIEGYMFFSVCDNK